MTLKFTHNSAMNLKFTHPDNAPERHEWQTEDGQEVEYIGSPKEDYVSIIRIASGEYYWLHSNGEATPINGNDTIRIIDRPKPVVRWVNEYERTFGNIYASRKAAEAANLCCTRLWKHTTHPDGSVTMEEAE